MWYNFKYVKVNKNMIGVELVYPIWWKGKQVWFLHELVAVIEEFHFRNELWKVTGESREDEMECWYLSQKTCLWWYCETTSNWLVHMRTNIFCSWHLCMYMRPFTILIVEGFLLLNVIHICIHYSYTFFIVWNTNWRK